MGLAKTVGCCVGVWLLAISSLHAWLNLRVVHARGDRAAFRVGFLPVT